SGSFATSLAALVLLIAATTAFTTALGLLLSLACRTTLAAMVSTYFALFAVYLGPVLATPLVDALIRGPARGTADAALRIVSPLLAARMPPGGNLALIENLGLHAAVSVALAVAAIAL